jgi:uncharacterized protein YndB with AHSA1/START domain
MTNATQTQNTVLTVTRVFDAPREAVWKAWSEPERVMRWWGPESFTSPSCEIDFRVGGKYLFCMKADSSGSKIGQKGIWNTGVYKEIVPMEKIVFTDNVSDEKGNIVFPEYYGMKNISGLVIIELTFETVDKDRTQMTLRHYGLPAEMQKEYRDGWNEAFDKLNESL